MKRILSSIGKFLLQTKLFWGLAVLVPGRDLFVADQSQRNKHLPESGEPVRRTSSGLEQWNHCGWDDAGDPDRRNRSIRRFNDGIGIGGLCDVADSAGMDERLVPGDSRSGVGIFFLCAYLVPLIAINVARDSAKPVEKANASVRWCGIILGAILAVLSVWWTVGQLGYEVWCARGVGRCSGGWTCFWRAQRALYHERQNAAIHCDAGDDGGDS